MNRKKSTRQLIGIDDIKNDSVVTADGELAFYFVHPSNLNVLPEQGVRAKVQELLGVLKGMAELELLALDSKESFQDNRQFYRQRLEAEDMPAIRGLLVQDRQHLDSVQTTIQTGISVRSRSWVPAPRSWPRRLSLTAAEISYPSSQPCPAQPHSATPATICSAQPRTPRATRCVTPITP